MNIIIAGDGKVGATLTRLLAAEGHDITLIEEAGLIEPGWLSEFSENSSPYTSTIVFLVRKDNPEHIRDWDDLTKVGVDVITPDPKSSGGACWNFLAAWYYADRKFADEQKVIRWGIFLVSVKKIAFVGR